MEVAGVGPAGLPLEKRHATALKKHARQAPYGKDTQTLVDINVRNVWEVDADQVTLANPQWDDMLRQALISVPSALGLEKQRLEVHLYKAAAFRFIKSKAEREEKCLELSFLVGYDVSNESLILNPKGQHEQSPRFRRTGI